MARFRSAKRLLCVACFVALSACRTISGTWAGRLGGEGPHSVGLRFEVVERGSVLSGRSFVEDSVTKIFDEDAPFEGTRSGDAVAWTEITGGKFKGKLVGDTLVGTYTFPVDPELPAHLANVDQARPLVLSR
jgi:hypothetical protein